tara:strand:- start:532 stop:846 length:315 start_codon:yes stop_codon:yes gene_type:complete
MNKDSILAFAIGCFVFMVPFMGFMFTADKLNSLQETIDIHNDITTGNATYLPGKVCMIKAGDDSSPADIVNFARACAAAHESYLSEVKLAGTIEPVDENLSEEN